MPIGVKSRQELYATSKCHYVVHTQLGQHSSSAHKCLSIQQMFLFEWLVYKCNLYPTLPSVCDVWHLSNVCAVLFL